MTDCKYGKNSAITWDTDGVEMPAIDTARLGRWLDEVAASHGKTIGRLGYMFCDDPKILEVNLQFLQHDYFTDIITFDYSRGDRVSGDMVISLDTVVSNALLVGAPYERELHRVIVHGLLHLCGIDDKGPGEREVMESHEDAALALLDSIE